MTIRSLILLFLSALPLAAQWQDISSNVPGTITTNNIGPVLTDGNEVFVLGDTGVYRSTDNGSTFSDLNSVSSAAYNLGTANQIRFVEKVNGYIYLGLQPGSSGMAPLHRIQTGQATWTQAFALTGPHDAIGSSVEDITHDPTTDTWYTSSAFAGCYTSADGLNWVQNHNGLPDAAGVAGLARGGSITSRNGKAFVSMFDNFAGGIYETSDKGATWTFSGAVSGQPGEMAQIGNRILMATSGQSIPQDGTYFTDDNGSSWTKTNFLGNDYDIRANSNNLFAGKWGGLWFSVNDGITWDLLDTSGLPDPFTAIWMEPTDTDLYLLLEVGGEGKLYKRALSDLSLAPTTKFGIPPDEAGDTFAINEGDTFTLPALAGGPGISYQWKLDGSPIAGATSDTLTLDPVTTADSGVLTLEVTGTDQTITSNPITLKVVPSTPGHHDLSFKQVPRSENGTSVVLSNYRVVQFSAQYIALYEDDGTPVATRTDHPETFLTNGFIDSQDRIVAWSSARVTRLDSNTLADDPTFTDVPIGVQINDVIELPGQGYLVAAHRGATYNGNPLAALSLFDYDGNLVPSWNVGLTGLSTLSVNQPAALKIDLTPDGKIIAEIDTAKWPDGSGITSLVRINPDGSRDSSFSSTIESEIFEVMPDGKVVYLIGNNNKEIHRLNSDGSADTTFNTANSQSNATNTGLVAEPDGKILLYGRFEQFGSTIVNGYIRLNIDGTHDSSFDSTLGFKGLSANSEYPVGHAAYDPRGFFYLVQGTTNTLISFRDNDQRGIVRVFSDEPDLYLWRQSAATKVDQNGTLNLEVHGTGSSPISYQWYKNGTLIPGAISSIFSMGSFMPADAGTYSVTLTNASGTVTSQDIVVTIVGAPTIISLSPDQDILAGEALDISVAAEGAATLSYQWSKNGTPIPGATTIGYLVPTSMTDDSGFYTLTVSNSLGSVTSDPIVVTVNEVTGPAKAGVTPYGLGGDVFSLTVLPDKSYVVAGSFFNPSAHRYATKLEADGSLATDSWGTSPPGGANTTTRATALSHDGTKVYIGGDFTTISGTSNRYIARFHLDGTVDSTFTAPSFQFISNIKVIAELPNGQVYIGGTFVGVNPTHSNTHFARLNNDGSVDTSFATEINSIVEDIVVHSDGSAHVVGFFTQVNGTPYTRIVKLAPDGTIDPSFTPPTINNTIYSCDAQSDGKIVIGGEFLSLGGYHYRARLNPGGSIDISFDNTNIPNSIVQAVHVQADDRIVLGGQFSRYPGGVNSGAYLQRLNPDGSVDQYFRPGNGANSTVYDIDSTPDGCLYIAGRFTSAGGLPANRTAILTTSAADLAITSGLADQVADLGSSVTFTPSYYSATTATFQWFKNGATLAGETNESLTLSSLGSDDTAIFSVTITNDTASISTSAQLVVLAEPFIVTQPEPAALAVGSAHRFSVEALGASPLAYQWHFNGVPITGATSATLELPTTSFASSGCYEVTVTNGIGNATSHQASLALFETPGSTDSLGLAAGLNAAVTAVTQLPDGTFLLGGNFTQIAGGARTRLAHVDASGTLLPALSFILSAGVTDLAAQPDGKIIYTTTSGWGRLNADFTHDPTFPNGTNLSSAILIVGNDAYLGGLLGNSGVRKFNITSGVEDSTFSNNAATSGGPRNWAVESLALLPNGNIICGDNSARLAVLQPDGTPDPGFTSPLNPAGNQNVWAIHPLANGQIYIGGRFPGSVIRMNADGSKDTSFTYFLPAAQPSRLATVGSDLLVMGQFSRFIGGQSYAGILRVTDTGAHIPDFGPFPNFGISDSFSDDSGNLVISGWAKNGLARFVFQSSQAFAFTCQPTIPPTLNPGSSTTLSAGWIGGGPASYQWQKDGSNIPGATSAGYSITDYNPATHNGGYQVIITTPEGAFSSDATTLGSADPFLNYLTAAGVPAGQQGPDDDPDGDGNSNLFEYLFGSNPSIVDWPGTYWFPLATTASGDALNTAAPGAGLDPTKTYRVAHVRTPINDKDLTVGLQAGTDLTDFGTGGQTHPFGTPTDDGTYQTRTYYLTPAMEDAPSLFWRLSIDQ